MDRKIALHTAARRYCMENHHRWAEKYQQSGLPQEKAFHIFPRYLVLEALRLEIERIRPENAPSEEALLQQLTEAVTKAETSLTLNLKHNVKSEVALRTMKHEREALVQSIHSMYANLGSVEPLPFRRTLQRQEADGLWSRLRTLWGADCPWYPFKEGSPPHDLMVLHTDYFHSKHGSTVMRSVLADRGITRLFELREFGETDCEIDLALFTPAYSSAEGFWTTEDADWITYASHESSLTIGGDWLLEELKRQLPDWREKQYSGPFSTGDLRGTWTTA